jgi:hypothetical protein
LVDYGVSPEEAKAKVEAMSAQDLHRLASLTDRAAAGTDSGIGILIGIAILIILIIVIVKTRGVPHQKVTADRPAPVNPAGAGHPNFPFQRYCIRNPLEPWTSRSTSRICSFETYLPVCTMRVNFSATSRMLSRGYPTVSRRSVSRFSGSILGLLETVWRC